MKRTLWQYHVDTAAEVTDDALDEIDTLEPWEGELPRWLCA